MPAQRYTVGDTVGGFRLVRRLGAGASAEVHLAIPSAGGDPVAIKVPRPHVAQADVLAEASALWRARGSHVVRCIDAIDVGGPAPALVLDRLETSLPAIVRVPGGLSPAAAATVILPISTTLRRMHAAGVAHGGLTPDAVRFDERGAPVLIGFARARMFAPGSSSATLSSTPSVLDDVLALRRVAIGLTSTSQPTAMAASHRVLPIDELGDEAAIAADPHAWLAALDSFIGERVTPGPVPMVVDLGGGVRPGEVPHEFLRSGGAPEVVEAHGLRRRSADRRARPRRHRSAAVASAFDAIGDQAMRWAANRIPASVDSRAIAGSLAGLRLQVGAIRRQISGRVGPIRARAWAPAVGVLLALVIAMVVVPTGGGEATPVAAPTPVATAAAGEASGRSVSTSATSPAVDPSADDQSAPDGVARDGVARDGAAPGTSATDASMSDPETAAVALMSQRAECLAGADLVCIAEVVQSGGPAESADRVAIANAQGREPDGARWRATTAALIDLLGGAALVEVTIETATGTAVVPVLLVLSDGRWRLRSILAEPAAQPDAGL